MRLPIHSPYRVSDMASDTVGVLDHLGIASAHICGASMGGMIAQHLAANHPQRVRSLTLMMTTSGSRRLPQASLRVRQALVARPASTAFADLVAHSSALYRLIGSPAYPPDEARLKLRLETSIKRAFNPAGTARQLLAIAADGDRTALLSRIAAPTLVIHGTSDPLVPVQAGYDLAQRIAGAQADFIEGMGHDLPLALLPRFASGMAANASRAAAKAA